MGYRSFLVLLVLARLSLPASAEGQYREFVYTLRFKTEPKTGVTITVPTLGAVPASQEIRLDYGEHQLSDPAELIFARAGYLPRPIKISAQEARAASEKGGIFPLDGSPIALESENYWMGRLVWTADHPLKALALALGVALGAGLGVLQRRRWTEQKQFQSRFTQYAQAKDPTDSLLLAPVEGYILVQRLGKGGMATVYRAVPADTLDASAAVAIKILDREVFQDVDFQKRFQREVRAYQKLEHPNIVRLFSWREPDATNNFPYIILELVEGGTLAASVPAGGMPWSQAAPLLRELYGAVQFAHDRGVVHRDLKPDNIMLADGQVKVMDFGLAREANASQLTVSGTVLGTPSYMAPEQLSMGSSEIAVNQYALGAVTYNVLTGRLPHEAEDMMQLFAKVLGGAPVPPTVYRKDLAPEIEAVTPDMLERNAGARFASVSEAWTSLEAASRVKA